MNTTTGSLSGTLATPTSGTNTATINTGGSAINFTVNQTAAGTYAGVIAGAGDFTLGSSSTSTLTLAGTNTYTGTTVVNNGTLSVTGAISSTAAVTVDKTGGSLANAPVLSGAGNGTTTGLIAGAVTVGSGTGVGILAPGTAAVANGTLVLSAGGTALIVANNSQLQLGITNATVTAQISFANGVYTFNSNTYATANALFTSGDGTAALAIWNVAPATSANHDFLKLTGATSNLTVGTRASASYGDGSIRIMDAGLTSVAYGQVFNLIDWTQASAMSFSYTSGFIGGASPTAGDLDLADLSTFGAFSWDTSAFGTYGILVVVPEPSRALFLMLGLLGLMLRRRRRSGI